MIDTSVELSEGGQSSRSHPNDEILVLVSVFLWIGAQTGDINVPVDRLDSIVPGRRVVELDVVVGGPGDAARRHWDDALWTQAR